MTDSQTLGTIGLALIAIVLIIVDIMVVRFVVRGAPYIPTKPEGVEKMLALIDVQPGMKAVDIGSGDGRIVIALAQAGMEADGYEVNPLLVWISRRNIQRAGLEQKAKIHQVDLWKADLSQYNVITLFGVGYIMRALEKKLRRELKPGSQIISLGFKFPTWQYREKNGSLYTYRV